MSEVHRYQVVQMLSEAGGKINYDPHGPWIVTADNFDRVTVERDAALGRELQSRNDLAKSLADHFRKNAEISALQQRLTAADERADALEGLLLQTNELLYAIQGDPGSVPSSAIDAMRGEVFTALTPAENSTCNQVREESGLPTKNPCQACGHGACIDR